MERAHVIETLAFEIAFANETDAHALHHRMGDFIAGPGLAVIDEVFSEYSRAGEVLRLEQLELDLGLSGPDWTEAEAEARLREALRRALHEVRSASPGGAQTPGSPRPVGRRAAGPEPAVARPMTSDLAEAEMVWRYLQDGRLDWRFAAAGDRTAFDAMTQRVVEVSGAVLAARLQAAPDRARLIARLARQWPTAAIEVIWRRLSASEATNASPGGSRSLSAAQWEQRLLQALASGPQALPPPPPITEATWSSFVRGEPEVVRARFRAAARDPAVRRDLAGLLDRPRLAQFLALWGLEPDGRFLIELVMRPEAWRLGGSTPPTEIAAGLRMALLDHLRVDGRHEATVEALMAALVEARASAEGLAPARIAEALARSWPKEMGATWRARLWAIVGAAFGVAPEGAVPDPDTVAEAPPPTAARLLDASVPGVSKPVGKSVEGPATRRPGWSLAVAGEADREAVAEQAWRSRLQREPIGLLNDLRRRGRTVADRRRLARRLTPARWADILSLGLGREDASFIATLVAAEPTWRAIAPGRAVEPIGLLLRTWFLDHLLLAPASRALEVDDLVRDLVERWAAYHGIDASQAASRLARAWADGDDAGGSAPTKMADRLISILATVVEAPSSPSPPQPPGQHRAAAERDDRRTQLMAAVADVASASAGKRRRLAALLREALAEDRAWTLEALWRDAADTATLSALSGSLTPELILDLTQAWLNEADARLVLALAPAAGTPDEAGFWATVLDTVRASRSPGGAGSTGLLRRLLRANPPNARQARLTAIRAVRSYLAGEIETRATPSAAHPAAAPAPTPRPTRSAVGSPATSPHSTAPPVRLADWTERLPARVFGGLAQATGALLSPVSAGLAQLEPLDEPSRRALARRLHPQAGAALMTLDTLTAAARQADLAEPPETWRGLGWRTLLRELFEEGRAFDPSGLAIRWLETWRTAVGPEAARPSTSRALAEALIAETSAPAEAQTLAAAIRAEPTPGVEPAASDLAPEVRFETAAEAEAALGDVLYVANAGVVLLGPYIPMLFRRLALTQDGRFVDEAAAERAAHLLQFVVDGDPEPSPEHQLPLNKLICGLDLAWPLSREIHVTPAEQEVVESLLRAVIQRWSIIGRTSVAGLRESFLQREGALTFEPDAWRLRVAPRAFDMLIDQLPWGYSTLRLPWMDKVMHVDWR